MSADVECQMSSSKTADSRAPGVDIHRVLTPGVDIQYRWRYKEARVSSESARGLGLVTTWPRTLAHDVRRVEAAHAAPRGVPPPAWAGQRRTV